MLNEDYQVFRNVCPRNCYGTCGMLSYVSDGKLKKVEGDPLHGYTQGKLCVKGYTYPEYVYHPDRIRYPLYQHPRGSGNWERISWEEALTMMSEKLIELRERYGSNLAASYYKATGNLGLLHFAVEAFFNSLGAHTQPEGNICLAAGLDAMTYDFGEALNPDPESMTDSKLIVLWGVNPAWTAVNQMKFIYQARDNGAKVIVIDPIQTPTAKKADIYIQIKPGTDGLLALGVAKVLWEQGCIDQDYVREKIWGWEHFRSYLEEKINLEEVSEITGVRIAVILELAKYYSISNPCAAWIGFGLQRHKNGGQSARAINALSAITGKLEGEGGGVFYLHPSMDIFPLHLLNYPVKNKEQNRKIDINNYPREIISLSHPPVKFLWLSCGNPLSQSQDIQVWEKMMSELELVVVTDLFMTETTKMADLILPAASHFEEMDVNISYWHYWVAINEKTLPAYHEAKSDLEIVRLLTRRLNELSPHFSDFPEELTPADWINKEFTPQILQGLGLTSWEELKEKPRKLRQAKESRQGINSKTKSGKFEVFSAEAKRYNLAAIPKYKFPRENYLKNSLDKNHQEYPLRLISSQHPYHIHTQYSMQSLGKELEDVIEMNPLDAKKREIKNGDLVQVYNNADCLLKKAKITATVPPNVVRIFQGGKQAVNRLIEQQFTDMGMNKSKSRNVAFYSAFVECRRSKSRG